MHLRSGGWLDALGSNTRILLLVGLPVEATAVITTCVVHSSTRRFVEGAIGDQMIMQDRIVAHLVAIAEQGRPAGMTPEEINRYLLDIAGFAKSNNVLGGRMPSRGHDRRSTRAGERLGGGPPTACSGLRRPIDSKSG